LGVKRHPALLGRRSSTLYPTDPQLRARTEQWLDWQIATLSPAFRPLYVALVRDRSPLANIPDLLAAARTMFDRLNRSLGEQPWVAGAQQTIADVAVGPLVHRWFALGLAAAEHEALQRFYTRVLGDAAFYKHVASVPLA
jgi:glutathione S-transferase